MGKEIDAEMKDKEEAPKAAEPEPEPAPPTTAASLAANIKLIEKAVKAKETRAVFGKLLRQTAAVRRRLTSGGLQAFVSSVLPAEHASAQALHSALAAAGTEMDAEDGDEAAAGEEAAAPPAGEPLPEVEMYAYLLVLMYLADHKAWEEAKALATAAVDRLSAFNRRTLDVLGARLYGMLSLAHERTGSLPAIRSRLLALHRTAALRHDAVGQETLLNLLLRGYLEAGLYSQAEALRARAQRAEAPRSTQQAARYLYYLGRIRAIQLEYSEAKDCLTQAARKAPSKALGFRVTVQKWLVLVRLLLGEVPDRSEFTAPDMRAALAPYFQVTQAVRLGDLQAFSAAAAQHDALFRADRTRNLIVRLRHNVIRAGLRRMSLAYSRISLADVAAKLGLASVADTESIVCKAIRDGGIDATVDHDGGFMRSGRPTDVYSGDEPQAAFHARIAFCMDIHNEAVRAMRFDPGHKAQQFEDANKLRERQEQELQAALEDDEMDI